ncbi:hypothetical protein KCV26_12400 [Petrimonas sulfuriphila]|jgi:hypothetical protein|uniref:hypothetical protein n=1 Tax=Petrimonas TaxID=307628 RepID=UPI00324CEB16
MNSYKEISYTLDLLIQQIAKVSTLVPQNGLTTGKIGIAILLYQYGKYRNDLKMTDYADILIELILQEMKQGVKRRFDDGLYGIVWGIHYLIKKGFVQADEDIFDEVDNIIFRENNKAYFFNDLGAEAEKALYIWNRFISVTSSTKSKWEQHIENCVNQFHKILILKYITYILPVFSCRTLIRFFHICQTFWKYDMFRQEIGVLYEELPEIVRISFKEEKSISEKYILATLINEIPTLEGCVSTVDLPQSMTLVDANNFYLTQWILDKKISIPKTVDKTILSIIKNHRRISGLINQLNSDNAALGNDAGGLAWVIMQWCINKDNMLTSSD